MPRGKVSAHEAATIGLALLAASEVPNFMAGMLPSLMTIRRFGADEGDRKALRRGEVAGVILSMGVAFGASLAAGSPLPFVAALVVLAILLYMYEDAMRNPAPDAVPINHQERGANWKVHG
jgi:hypothetical protein